jgi:hypothetical protein
MAHTIQRILMSKGIDNIMLPRLHDALPVSKQISGKIAKQHKAMKNNLVLFVIKIEKIKTEECTNRFVHVERSILNKKFQPNNMLSRDEHTQKMMYLTMKSGQDPDKFGTAIAFLETNYSINLYEEDKTTVLCGAVGSQYTVMVTSKEELIGHKDKGVICDALAKSMYRLWRVSGSRKGQSSDGPDETSFKDLIYLNNFSKNRE